MPFPIPTAPRWRPPERPRWTRQGVKGVAKALRNRAWNTMPAMASPAPAIHARQARGRRMSQKIMADGSFASGEKNCGTGGWAVHQLAAPPRQPQMKLTPKHHDPTGLFHAAASPGNTRRHPVLRVINKPGILPGKISVKRPLSANFAAGPVHATEPSFKARILLPVRMAVFTSWVTMMMVVFFIFVDVAQKFGKHLSDDGNPENAVGSSSSKIRPPWARAPAINTFLPLPAAEGA